MLKPSICLLVGSLLALLSPQVSHSFQASPPRSGAGVADAEGSFVGSESARVVRDMGGVSHDLTAGMAAGKAVALVFWQTWCRSCEREAPQIAAWARAHADDVEFYGVIPGPNDFVDDDQVGRTARKWGYDFPQVRDRDLRLTQEFHVSGTPTIIVLGPGGNITYRGRRPPEDWAAVTRTPTR